MRALCVPILKFDENSFLTSDKHENPLSNWIVERGFSYLFNSWSIAHCNNVSVSERLFKASRVVIILSTSSAIDCFSSLVALEFMRKYDSRFDRICVLYEPCVACRTSLRSMSV